MRQYLLDTLTTTALLYRRPPVVALVDPWLARHAQATRRGPWREGHYRPGKPL